MYKNYRIEQSRKNTVNVAQENKELLDSLVKRMYSQNIEIIVVDYRDGQIYYQDNAEEKRLESKSIDSDMENLLLKVFESLNCENIFLYKESYGKILGIYMGDIIVFGRNLAPKTLIYCENKSTELHDEILPNWYYDEPFNM